jgi:molybdopterin-guanine dinucleotide biosynthesis protein A
MARRSDIVGAVLAGGESRRMGRDKALLTFGGSTLVGHAAGRLEQLLETVVVACGRPRDLGTPELPQLPDRFPGRGPLAGIHAALCFAAGRPVLVLACDLALVPIDLLAELLERIPASGAGGLDGGWVVAAAAAGEVQPLCALYGPGCRRPLEAALIRGELKVGEALSKLRVEPVEACERAGLSAARQLSNVNRPQDYQNLLGSAAGSAQ